MPPILPAPRTATRTLGNCAGTSVASTAISAMVFLVLIARVGTSYQGYSHSRGACSKCVGRAPSPSSFGPAHYMVMRPPTKTFGCHLGPSLFNLELRLRSDRPTGSYPRTE